MTSPHVDIGFAIFGDENLAKRGATIGVDPAADPAIAKKGFTQIRGVGENLPFKTESVGRVSIGSTLEYLELLEALAEAHRVLKPEGTVHIFNYEPEIHNISIQEFRGEAERAGFSKIRIRKSPDFDEEDFRAYNAILTK